MITKFSPSLKTSFRPKYWRRRWLNLSWHFDEGLATEVWDSTDYNLSVVNEKMRSGKTINSFLWNNEGGYTILMVISMQTQQLNGQKNQ